MSVEFNLKTPIIPKNLEKMSDEKLCSLVKDGCSEAEEILVNRYWRVVRSLSRPYFLAGGDSEDLTQEGMLGLINAIREYDDTKAEFSTFLSVCVRRRIYTAIRNAQGKKNQLLNMALSFEQLTSDSDKPRVDISADLVSDPELFVIDREETIQAKSIISSLLSPFEQRVLSLYLDGFSYLEMSQRLNKSEKSVDNAVQRIRKKLAHLNR